MAIELDDILKIIQEARSKIGAQIAPPATPDGQPDNPPGWEDNVDGFERYGDPGMDTNIRGGTLPPSGPPAGPPQSDPGLEIPVDPGMRGPTVPGDPGEWRPKAYAYGHLATLTPEQASAFQMMMLIQGHNGDTIGRGRVIDHPVQRTPNTGREQVAGA